MNKSSHFVGYKHINSHYFKNTIFPTSPIYRCLLLLNSGDSFLDLTAVFIKMPGKTKIIPPPPANSCQPGVARSLLYNGSKFQGHQKSKGNCYDVEVVLQVSIPIL